MNIPKFYIFTVCMTYTVLIVTWNIAWLPIFGWHPTYYMNCSRATLDVICVLLTGPLVGTPVCLAVVYMLPALHRPAFTIRVVGKGGWLPRFLFKRTGFMLCFGYLCINGVVLYIMSIIFWGGGGGLFLWWGGGSFYRFLWFLRVVSLCGAASVI